MRSFHLSFLLMSSFVVISCSTMPPSAAARFDAGMDLCVSSQMSVQEPLPVDRTALGELIDRVFDGNGSDGPGVAVMVMHDGRVIVQRQYGMASLEHGVPFTPNHVVRLPYSEGREFIAIAAILMEDDGLISLDNSVRDYFPRLPAWSQPVTIRDLIHHHSGFVDEWSVLLLMHDSMANRFDESQFLRLLYDQPTPEVEPGTGYMYSNSDYGLLRLVLEKAAGERLSSYMMRRMLEPLNMNSTHLIDDFMEVVPHHAPFYAPDGEGYRHQEMKTSPGGHYAIATTACDLAQWAEAHSDPTSEVSRAITRLMKDAEPLPGRDGHYAFGQTFAEVGDKRVVRHEGVSECNYLTRIPDLGLSVITFSNRYYAPEENRAIVDFLLDSAEGNGRVRFPTEPVAFTAEELARYAGRYVSTNIPSWESRTMARDLIGIDVAGNILQLDWPSWDRFVLVPVGGDAFSLHSDWGYDGFGMLLEFSDPDGDGPLELVIRYSDGHPSEKFVRLERWTPSPALLQRVAGTYHSAHLDYTWTLMIGETGKLILRAPTMADIPVEPFQENEFLLRHEKFPGVPSYVWLRFHENEAGEVTHLTVWDPRLMDHRFDRR